MLDLILLLLIVVGVFVKNVDDLLLFILGDFITPDGVDNVFT